MSCSHGSALRLLLLEAGARMDQRANVRASFSKVSEYIYFTLPLNQLLFLQPLLFMYKLNHFS